MEVLPAISAIIPSTSVSNRLTVAPDVLKPVPKANISTGVAVAALPSSIAPSRGPQISDNAATCKLSSEASTSASASAALAARPTHKYVPIRPSFRPLLPKPSPIAAAAAGSGNITLLSTLTTGSDTTQTHVSTAATKPKPKPKTAKKASLKPKAPKAKKASKATTKKSLTNNETTINDPHNASNDSTTFTTEKNRNASKKMASIPVSVSPASLITKRSKSAAGSGLADTLSPLHFALSAESSNLLSSGISSLPSPHSSPWSSPSSQLDMPDNLDAMDIESAFTPPADTWASQTADEILVASTEDFFWLSPESLDGSDSASSADTNSFDQPLTLAFRHSTPEELGLDDFYGSDIGLDVSVADYLDNASNQKQSTSTEQQTDLAFQPEPFYAFEYSPEPDSLESNDPYGFLDLGINI